MNRLWGSSGFTTEDYALFKYFHPSDQETQDSLALDANEDDMAGRDWLKRCFIQSQGRATMRRWTSNPKVFGISGNVRSAAILLCPQATHRQVSKHYRDDNPSTLKCPPFDVATFKEVSKHLHLHKSISHIFRGSSAAWFRVPCQMGNVQARVYILRSQSSLSNRMALAVTYVPPTPASQKPSASNARGSKMYAVFFGCSRTAAEEMYLELKTSKDSIFSPFTMIKLFLEKEANNRIREVEEAIHNLQTVISNFEFQPPQASKLRASKKKEQDPKDDPKKMVTLYLNVGSLKNGLREWRTQLDRMLQCCDEFRLMTSTQDDIDPTVYIQRIIDDYDTRVFDCETVMEGASLTFQMETAYQAKQDTEIAIKDGKAMKTMAVVTMFFLPGTFFATLLAIPEFQSLGSVSLLPPWSIYLIMFLPSTAILMSAYFIWLRYETKG